MGFYRIGGPHLLDEWFSVERNNSWRCNLVASPLRVHLAFPSHSVWSEFVKKKKKEVNCNIWLHVGFEPQRKHVCEPPKHSIRRQMGASINGGRRANLPEKGRTGDQRAASAEPECRLSLCKQCVLRPPDVKMFLSHSCLLCWPRIVRPTVDIVHQHDALLKQLHTLLFLELHWCWFQLTVDSICKSSQELPRALKSFCYSVRLHEPLLCLKRLHNF